MIGISKPQLEVSKVISILISSDFLQMHSLITECIRFVRYHLQDVVKLPIDMNCLNPGLLKKLAIEVPP